MLENIKKNIVFDCIQNFIMCIIISVSITFLLKTGGKIASVTGDVFLSWCINMVLDTVIPVGMIGTVLAGKITKNNTVKYFIQIFMISTINVSVILFAMLAIKVGFGGVLKMLYFKAWIPLVFIAYGGALLFTPVSMKLASLIKTRGKM